MAILPHLIFFCNKNNVFIRHNFKIMIKYFFINYKKTDKYENKKEKNI